jgi:hypothetical protein
LPVNADPAPVPVKKAELAKNIFLEVQGDNRRVLIQSTVCLREGGLEQLLTTDGKRGKKHEAILAAYIDAEALHAALLVCKAKVGHPVRFQPNFEPPAGTVIRVTLEYKDKDKVVRIPAQQWIRSTKTKKDLDLDWVFAGSVLFPDPIDKTKKPFYGANYGDVICVSNFETALLDLPVEAPRIAADGSYEAHTERIPDLGTPVLIILEPVLDKK